MSDAPFDKLRVSGKDRLKTGSGSALLSSSKDEPVEAWGGIYQRAGSAHTPLGWRHWLALPPVALAAIAYFPVTGCYFFSDDFLNLYHIANDSLLQYLVTPNGGHVLVARNAVFYVTEALFGPRPEYYYWTAFLTHLLNVWLLFRLVALLTGRAPLASFGAAVWGLSPCTEGTIGWYAVYGHAMVATALLIILLQAVRLAARAQEPSRPMRAFWYVVALVAATSFGTGIGVALALPLALALLLPRRGWLPPLASLIVVVPLVYVLLTWAYEWLSATQVFGLRNASQLAAHWTMIPLFWVRLTALGLARLLPGWGFAPSADPRAWYALLGGLLALLLAALRQAPRAMAKQLGALVLLLLGSYLIIAVGRGYLLSQISLELVVQLCRYHYVGQLLLTLLLCLIFHILRPALRPGVAGAGVMIGYGLILLLWLRDAPPIDQHPDARRDTQETLAAIQAAVAAQPPGAAVYLDNRTFAALPLPSFMFPGWAAVFISFVPENVVDGRPVYFVERKAGVRARAAQGRRTATLMVAPQRQ